MDFTVSTFLGAEIATIKEGLVLHFTKYISDLVSRYDIGDRTAKVPASTSERQDIPRIQDELQEE